MSNWILVAIPRLVSLKAMAEPDLRHRLKRAALERDITVSNLIRDWAEDWLERNGF